jgi:hypothetical protein
MTHAFGDLERAETALSYLPGLSTSVAMEWQVAAYCLTRDTDLLVLHRPTLTPH